MAADFTEEEFPTMEAFQDEDRAIPCREVERNTPFKIMKEENITTKNGEAIILTLKSGSGTILRA